MSYAALALDRESSPLRGIAFLVFGLSLFTVQDVIIKLLSGGYPTHQIVFFRGLVAMLPILAILFLEGGPRLLRSARRPALILRGLCGFICFTAYYMALAALPLADAVTLFYASPLFVTTLSWPVLGEAVGLRRWLAVSVGFIGVLVMVGPPGGGLDPAMLLAVGSAFAYAGQILMTRRLSRTEAGSTLAFYAMLTFVAASGVVGLAIGDGRFAGSVHPSLAFLLRPWVWPAGADLFLLAICGLIAGTGFYCLGQAYRLGPVSVIAPFEYSSLPWAILWGYLIWADLPSWLTLLGVALVVGSGLYIIHREGVRGRRLVRGRPLR